MVPHIRKLLNATTGNDYGTSSISSSDRRALNVTSSPLSLLRRPHDQVDYEANYRRPTPPFDSSMTLTILVLLTALFFMGFFSIYIRRFADVSLVEASRRRHRRRLLQSSPRTSDARFSTTRKGADPVTLQSLPVISYPGEDDTTKHLNTDCPICLGEFEETESVKMIPYCAHVFHQGCIDTWLSSHDTCPLCRTNRLFPVQQEEKESSLAVDINAIAKGKGAASGSGSNRPELMETTVGGYDTWTSDVRRINSHSSLPGERATSIHRTLSF